MYLKKQSKVDSMDDDTIHVLDRGIRFINTVLITNRISLMNEYAIKQERTKICLIFSTKVVDRQVDAAQPLVAKTIAHLICIGG